MYHDIILSSSATHKMGNTFFFFYHWLIDSAGKMGSPEENFIEIEFLFIAECLSFYIVGL